MTSPDASPATPQAAGGVSVHVPATSANLGPGFDSLGLALELYDDVTVALADRTVISVTGEGAGRVARDESHLVVRAIAAAFRETGVQFPGVRLTAVNRIPHARGLGSSAAAICAGLRAGFALAGARDVTAQAVFELACGIEGHPDNVAACVFGGVTIAWSGEAGPRAVRLRAHPQLRPIAFVPETRTSTASSRGTLPAQVPHADAAANAARAALLVHGLTADPSVLLEGTRDWLHQPYRLEALPIQAELIAQLRARGIPAAPSGSGPTVLALARDDAEAHVARQLAAERAGPGITAHQYRIAADGMTVTTGGGQPI